MQGFWSARELKLTTLAGHKFHPQEKKVAKSVFVLKFYACKLIHPTWPKI